MVLYESWRSISNGDKIIAIPDSEANQKLAHRWVLNDVNGTVEDSEGDADGTNNGVTSVSGDWAGGTAGEGDGTGHIETTTWGDFGGGLADGFAIAWSFASTGDDISFFGTRTDGGDRIEAGIGTFGVDDNKLKLELEDSNGDSSRLGTDEDVNDGETKRVVWVAPSVDPVDWEVWINQSEVDVTVELDDDLATFENFGQEVPLFARNFEGDVSSEFDGIMDDVCVFDDTLTASEIESYSNPWD